MCTQRECIKEREQCLLGERVYFTHRERIYFTHTERERCILLTERERCVLTVRECIREDDVYSKRECILLTEREHV